MKSRNGTDYQQNYDVIVKWLADALRGETLEVIGVLVCGISFRTADRFMGGNKNA